jgi:hypothetical protein
MQFIPHSAKVILLSLALGPMAVPFAQASTASDLAFTDFANADVNSLANGQVLQARGGLLDFQRGISSQSLYLIDAPVDMVRQKLTSWNPATHSELKVWLHQALPARPNTADFDLKSLPDNSSVNYLVNATAKLDPANPSLQVDKSEAQLIASMHGSDPRTQFNNAWSQILAGRASRFLSGNFTADHYAASDGDISPLSEIKSLLRSDAKIYQRFHQLLVNTPIYNSNRAVPANLYYESFDVEGGAVLGTGGIYEVQPNSGAPVQAGAPVLAADIEYFVNSGIYVSLELHQFLPVVINGKPETLVWRDDLVSTANVAYLHGTERLASGMIMLQDVKQAIDAFRSEFK